MVFDIQYMLVNRILFHLDQLIKTKTLEGKESRSLFVSTTTSYSTYNDSENFSLQKCCNFFVERGEGGRKTVSLSRSRSLIRVIHIYREREI